MLRVNVTPYTLKHVELILMYNVVIKLKDEIISLNTNFNNTYINISLFY